MQEVAHDVQRGRKLKELADELEMVPQLQSLQHDGDPPLTLLRRWRSEIENAVETHSLLVHHLKCIGLTETSDRYVPFALHDIEPNMENVRCEPDLIFYVIFMFFTDSIIESFFHPLEQIQLQ